MRRWSALLLIEDLSNEELLEYLNAVEQEWRYVSGSIKPEDVSDEYIGIKSRAEKLKDKYMEILTELRNRNMRLTEKQLISKILKEY